MSSPKNLIVMAPRMIREGSRILLSKDDVGDSAKFILCVKRKPLLSDNVEILTIGVDQSDSGH